MKFIDINEGGWVSTKTQNTKITPSVIGKSAEAVKKLINDFNRWLERKDMPAIKSGHPVGSGYYWKRDLAQNPEKEYGDIDYLIYIPRIPETTNAQNSTIYADLFREFLIGNQSVETDNGTNLIMNLGNDYIQVDLIHGYYEDKEWLEALVPEYNVKGIIGTSLYSALAEVLNLSINSYGVQVKLRGRTPVSFRQSKGTELFTISKNPKEWAKDILVFYANLANVSPKIKPGITGVTPGSTKFSDIAEAIKWLGQSFEDNELFGKSVNFQSKEQFQQKIKEIFINKMELQIGNPKFNKAETAAAQAKVKETIAKFEKAISVINDLL